MIAKRNDRIGRKAMKQEKRGNWSSDSAHQANRHSGVEKAQARGPLNRTEAPENEDRSLIEEG